MTATTPPLTTTSSVEDVLAAVREALPAIRANGKAAEDQRWLPQENIDLLEKAGVFRIATPKRFGGLGLSLAEQVSVLTEIATACPATGWTALVWVSNAWMATLCPDRAQEEIFATDSVRVSGGFTPTGTLTPTEGGYLLNGNWRFNSGCRGADWNLNAAILELPDGGHDEVVAAVPMSEFTIADDWDTSAAAATGSCTSTAKDVFVPAHRVLSYADAIMGTTADRTATEGRDYSLFTLVMAESAGTFIGIAKGALELFLERIPGRGIAYTAWTDQTQHPLTQHQVATAANKIAAAEGLQSGYLAKLQQHADAGTQPDVAERAAVRGQAAYAIQLTKESVEILFTAAGATVIQKAVPLQRFHRDIQGLSLHGLLLLSTNLEVQGRVLLGLDPGTQIL